LFNYHFVIFDYAVMPRAIVNTLILAGSGATIGTALGTLSAYLVFRSRVGGRTTLDILSGIPLAIPGAILAVGVAIAWIQSALYGTLLIMLVAFIARFTPYAQRSVGSALLSISREFDECSRVAGASWWATMRDVVLPLLKPGIIAAWILLFIIFVRELGMSLFLYRAGTETLSVAIYLLMIEKPAATAAACIIQVVVILAAVALLRLVTREDELAL
jgi:iron(III) transport system permease protein